MHANCVELVEHILRSGVAANNHDDPHGLLIQIKGHPSSARVVKKLQWSQNLVVFLQDSPMGHYRKPLHYEWAPIIHLGGNPTRDQPGMIFLPGPGIGTRPGDGAGDVISNVHTITPAPVT